MDNLKNELNIIRSKFADLHTIIISEKGQKGFNNAIHCYLCDKILGDDKVRDYCHISGKYRGATQNACNLKFRIYPYETKVPIVFHNLHGYDGHLIIYAIGQTQKNRGQINCIK